MNFKVEEGFGPVENIKGCWGVKSHSTTFVSEESAQEFAEQHYEAKVSELMESHPDWWKSYWVRVTPFKQES